MSLQQVALVIPPNIEAGLLAGEFVRKGSVVRNLAGEIVKHLDEAPIPDREAGQIALRIPKALKNHKAIGVGLGIAALIAGGTYLIHKRTHAKAKNGKLTEAGGSAAFDEFSSALNDYLVEAQEGNLSVKSIDQLLDAVTMLQEVQRGASVVVEIPADKLATLVSVIRDYTERLAGANSVTFSAPTSSESGDLQSIADMLSFQKDIFDKAA